MITPNRNKPSGISTWLVSLVVLLSVIGFSAITTRIADQKQTKTEVNISGNQRFKKGSSFKRLQSGLVTKNFLIELCDRCTAESYVKHLLLAAFNAAVNNANSFPRSEDLLRFRYRARNANDLSNA